MGVRSGVLALLIVAAGTPLRAASPGPRGVYVMMGRNRPTPSDTVKGAKVRDERRAPARPRLRRGGSGSAPAVRIDPRLVPDQPWETEFYVENDLPVASRAFARAAAYVPQR